MLQFANGDCGERERQQIQKKLAEASELVGKQVSDTMSSMTTMIDSKRPSDPSGGAAAEDPANPAGLTVQPPLREEAAAAVSKSDLDRLALGAGLFFGQLVKEVPHLPDTPWPLPTQSSARRCSAGPPSPRDAPAARRRLPPPPPVSFRLPSPPPPPPPRRLAFSPPSP